MNQNARRSARLGALMLVALAATLGLAACGGAKSPAVASLGTTTSSSDAGQTNTTDTSGRGAPESQGQLQADALKFSQCMRSHGVPNFPDPSPGGGFAFPAGSGLNPSSPAVKSAQAHCQKYMGGGPGGPGTVTHPSAQWLAQMVKAAACMRRHGYPDFPDPRTSIPSNPFGPGGTGVISNIDGVIFLFPSSIDTTSPQFYRAADACKFPDHHH
jgi:hypothetical protein